MVQYIVCQNLDSPIKHSKQVCDSMRSLQERIATCEAQLAQLDEQVVMLKGEFETKKGLELELKSSLSKAEATLNSANSLLSKLGGEKNRWQDQVHACCAGSASIWHSPQPKHMQTMSTWHRQC